MSIFRQLTRRRSNESLNANPFFEESLVEYLVEFALFSGKTLIVVGGIMAVMITLAILIAKGKGQKPSLDVEDLTKKFRKYKELLEDEVLTNKELKAVRKERKKREAEEEKSVKSLPKVFVIDFEGDIKASAVEQMQDEITAILSMAEKTDEVVFRLESPGGMVHSYGFAAAQMLRIREQQIPLTVCVDKVAASGGYMMACTANKIIAAPFAILGSIGVLAQVPNLHRLLKKNNIDYEEIKAGEYKRTISLLGEITDKGREKFMEQIEDTHKLFKEFVGENRQSLEIAAVATGETWYGSQALAKGLIDKIQTSDQYLLERSTDHKVIKISMKPKKSVVDKLTESASLLIERSLEKLLTKPLF
ncbi:MAG: protease SohB [Bdellovibrionales bacterium]|nr:protease SohB [Bdellovibrionales bacterium]